MGGRDWESASIVKVVLLVSIACWYIQEFVCPALHLFVETDMLLLRLVVVPLLLVFLDESRLLLSGLLHSLLELLVLHLLVLGQLLFEAIVVLDELHALVSLALSDRLRLHPVPLDLVDFALDLLLTVLEEEQLNSIALTRCGTCAW